MTYFSIQITNATQQFPIDAAPNGRFPIIAYGSTHFYYALTNGATAVTSYRFKVPPFPFLCYISIAYNTIVSLSTFRLIVPLTQGTKRMDAMAKRAAADKRAFKNAGSFRRGDITADTRHDIRQYARIIYI